MNTKTERPREVISSRNHPAIKRIRALSSRVERDRTSRFVVEGLRFFAQAAQSGAPIESVVYAPERIISPFARRLVAAQHHAGVPCLPVSPDVLASIAQNDDPQGLVAVVRQAWKPLSKARPEAGLCWIALDTVQSAGNLGTIIRTAEAVGAAGFLCVGPDVDPYAPACVRASMGALFAQDFVRATPEEFQLWRQRHGCALVGTSPSAPVEYDALRYPARTVLWMGWERKGLSRAQMAACDSVVRIPMSGSADSLNLAVATGVMLYEVLRQKRAPQVLAAAEPAS